jgi:hypothetical protein
MITPRLSSHACRQLPVPTSVGGGQLYVVRAPAQTGDPIALWTALHGLLPSRPRRRAGARPRITAEMVGHAGRVQLRLWLPAGQEPFVAALVRAAYPGAELVPTDAASYAPDADAYVGASRVSVRGAWLPLRTDHEGDPLASLFATLGRTGTDEHVVVAFEIRPRPDGWQRRARRQARRLLGEQTGIAYRVLFGEPPSHKPRSVDREQARAIDDKAKQVGFDVAIRVLTHARTQVAADEYLRAVAASLRAFNGPTNMSFARLRPRARARVAAEMHRRQFPTRHLSVLTPPELAGLWHLPTEANHYVDVVHTPKLPVPAEVPSDGRVLGVANFGGRERQVAVPWQETRRHMSIVGSSGAGKTALIEHLAIQDIHAGRSVVVFDAGDGSLCRRILAHIPAGRDVVWITPDDDTVSATVNFLEDIPISRRDLVAEQGLAIWQARWRNAWGTRSDALAKASLLAVLHRSDASLAMVARMLVDPALRRRILTEVDDPTGVGVGAFWRWFESLSAAQQTEVISPLSTKLTDFLIRPRLRRLLSGRSTIDLRRLLDARAIVLVDLSPGKWGPGAAELVGSFLFAAVVQAVLERADTPDVARPEVALHLDEFQTYVGGVPGTLETALQQLRKYGASITVATQSLAALPRATRDAIATNTRTKALFGLGLDDARYFAPEFAPLTAEALTRLGPYELAVRVALAGTTSAPFTAQALPPISDDPARAAAIGARATARYAKPVEQIDAELAQTLQPPAPEPSPRGVGRRSRQS